MAQTFTDDNFNTAVIEASKTKPVLVDFWASWCGPCQMQGPIVEKLAEEMGEKAVIGKLNTEEAMQTAYRFGIMSIPTLMVFRNGEPVEGFVGVQTAENLRGAINKHI